jgi:hypothetical protein
LKEREMYARTIVADLIPGREREAVRIFSEEIVPVIRQQPGYVATTIYMDEVRHQAQTVSFWVSQEAERSTSEGSDYLTHVTGLLRSCLVNRQFDTWEVAFWDQV